MSKKYDNDSGRRKVKFLLCSMILAGSPALASQQTGTVTLVSAATGSSPYAFAVTGMRTTKPSCATDDVWMIESPAGDSSKAMFSEALSAQLAGRTIFVMGTGTCTTIPNREDASYINV